jgi:hypothetical protein
MYENKALPFENLSQGIWHANCSCNRQALDEVDPLGVRRVGERFQSLWFCRNRRNSNRAKEAL